MHFFYLIILFIYLANLNIVFFQNMVDDTEIKLNFDYSNKRTKFKITAAIQKETPQEVGFSKDKRLRFIS